MALTVLKTCIYGGYYEADYKRPELLERRPKWEETARRVNRAGIILLRNEKLLPLTASQAGKTILVAGNNAAREELSGGGSGHVKGYNLKTYVQAVTETFRSAKVVHSEQPTDEQIRSTDLVMLFPGFSQKHLRPTPPTGHEGEGADRTFPLLDDALVARCCELNPKTLVCITAGGGVQMAWADKAAAIVHCLYGGQTGPDSLVDILTGKENPSGRLPFTIERRLEDSPGFEVTRPKPNKDRPYPAKDFPDWVKGDFYTNDDKSQFFVYDVNYHEGVFVGHRWHESRKIPVRYPFGYGLTYTTFAYQDLQLEVAGHQTVKLSFALKNTGQRPGAEVAQVYISPRQSSVSRPPQELKGFQRVTLQPGASTRVDMTLNADAFRYWHPHTKRWTVEPGEYEVRIGASSAEIRLRHAIRLPTP